MNTMPDYLPTGPDQHRGNHRKSLKILERPLGIEPTTFSLKARRKTLGRSQEVFANQYGFSPGTAAIASGAAAPVLVVVGDPTAPRPPATVMALSAGVPSQVPPSAQASAPAGDPKPCGMVPQPNGAVKLVPCR
jgi:hypothetical protein